LALLTLVCFTAAPSALAGCDDDDRPATPISVKATPLSSTGIMLQWSSRVGHYDIYIRDKVGRAVPEAPDIVGGATNENYHEFYGLQPDKEYVFSIRARTEGGREGCISKNASGPVSARTDTPEMNQTCHYYAQTAMENVAEMQKLGCELPDSPIFGRWATREGTQFSYCMTQKRAGSQEPEHFQWLRNQDVWACKEKKHQERCQKYRSSAVAAARTNRIFGCGGTGPRWTFDGKAHYDWCMSQQPGAFIIYREARARAAKLSICRKRRAEASQGGGGTSGAGSCAVPGEWSEMLAAHNEMRGNYCAAPLKWDCDLAKGAQDYADKCILGAHGNPAGIGENLANKWAVPDKYPAGTDREAFQDTWGCEEKLYDFTKPEIVGGFKSNCDPKPAGTGVNGHFTQVVWRGTTSLGCARAKCITKGDDGVEHTVTNWVCRYGPGGNDGTQLKRNVQKPPCGNAFHSLSEPTQSCFRGMELTASGACACPPGKRWNGRVCAGAGSTSTTTTPATEPTTTTDTCPRSRPVGTPPNCCPAGTRFDGRVCRQASVETPKRCPADRPVGNFPGCCPRGMTFDNGACRRPTTANPNTGNGGTNGNTGGCPRSRPVGTPPNCCPEGTFFQNGACRRPTTANPNTGNGGTNGNTGGCPRSRPVGSPPNCCPEGTRFDNGACRRPTAANPNTGNGGTNGSTGGCPRSRPVGSPPNCCPEGTRFDRGACVKPSTTTGPTPGTSPQTGKGSCTGGRVGRPPYCRCPSGTRLFGGHCRRIPKPTPTPTKPDDKVIVR
jgi:hypothetical protein